MYRYSFKLSYLLAHAELSARDVLLPAVMVGVPGPHLACSIILIHGGSRLERLSCELSNHTSEPDGIQGTGVQAADLSFGC